MTITVMDDLLLTASEVGIEAGSEPNQPRISIIAYSGGLMRVPQWGDVALDLNGLDASGQIALLADHDSRVSGVVGHGAAQVVEGRLLVNGILSGAGDAAKQIAVMTRGGFQFQASVGVTPTEHERVPPGETVSVNGRSLSAPGGFTLIRKGKLREVSVTPLGADANTSVAIAASHPPNSRNPRNTRNPRNSRPPHNSNNREQTNMDTIEVDEQAIRADERERLKQIEDICRGQDASGGYSGGYSGGGGWGANQKKMDALKAAAISEEIEVADLSAQVLNLMRESRPTICGLRRSSAAGDYSGIVPVAHPGVVPGAGVTTLEAAFLSRIGLAELGEKSLGALAMEHAHGLRATHALDLCRAALQMDGVDEPHGREEMVRAALSTYSLPVALGNVANKVLLEAYTDAPATWRSFAAIRSAGDFKDQTVIRPSFTGELKPVAPGGEVKYGSVSEWTAKYKIDTFGKILSIDRRDLINDDLSILDQTARAFGRAGMRRLNDLVFKVLLDNTGGFFSLANGNLLEGVDTALSVDALIQAITAMMTQRDDEGNDLDIQPRTLLVPPELQPVAKAILESEFIQQIADRQPTGNSLRHTVSVEVEPRLNNTVKYGSAASGLHWYLFSAPSNAALVVAFLEGKQAPTVEFFGLDQDVNRLAVSWRVYHDFGAALVDPRAAVRAKGIA